MTRIIIVRHGQTAWNEGQGERLRGRADIELDVEGWAQARSTAEKLLTYNAAVVYSSPLRRAMTTARIIAEPRQLQVQPIGGITDIDYGKWQGLTLKEAEADDEALYKVWLKSPEQARFPSGEGLEDVRVRALRSLEETASDNPDRTIVMVSHKVVCKVLISNLAGLGNGGFWNIQQDLCALNIVEMTENGPVIRLVNDTCHLKKPA